MLRLLHIYISSKVTYFGIVLPRSHRPKSNCTVSGQNAVNRNDWEFCFESTLLIWIKIPMSCSFSIGITWICYIPLLCLCPKYSRFFRGTNIHPTATAIYFIWKAFVGHHIRHSIRVSEVLLCAVRYCFFCRNRKVLTEKTRRSIWNVKTDYSKLPFLSFTVCWTQMQLLQIWYNSKWWRLRIYAYL